MEELDIRHIKYYVNERLGKVSSITKGKDYYKNKTDVKDKGIVPNTKDELTGALRNADNRISHNFHQILVDEKASYLFTYPPIIDIDNNEAINDRVDEILGETFSKKLKDLCVEASNMGNAWVHLWIDMNDNNAFKFEKMESEQIIPFYTDTLPKRLVRVLRVYMKSKLNDNMQIEKYIVVEDWTEDTFNKYLFRNSLEGEIIKEVDNVKHNIGRVPFIEFKNNSLRTSDLDKYKDLIDIYDRVVSGYVNDIEDIQQVIWIVQNYAEDPQDFIASTKRFKTIFTESDGEGGSGDVKTLSIDIPVEARNSLLEIIKKQIYESGQGLQQDTENFGNASGVALKFFYRKLELKSGLLETEFRESISELVKAILDYYNIPYSKINQTWTRNIISIDTESAQIATQSVGILPTKTILENHPWVDDVNNVIELLEEEKQKNNAFFNSYNKPVQEDNINE